MTFSLNSSNHQILAGGCLSLTILCYRMYELYDPLDFLAEVTQHIPNKGEHQVRYYGFYSNKSRGILQKKKLKPAPMPNNGEPDTPYRRKCRMTWAVFEVNPLKCPSCGGNMKIVSFIEEEPIIEKILRPCNFCKEERPGAGERGRLRFRSENPKKPA